MIVRINVLVLYLGSWKTHYEHKVLVFIVHLQTECANRLHDLICRVSTLSFHCIIN